MKKLLCAVAALTAFQCAKADEFIVKPGSSKGYIAVVNAQTNVPESVFVEASETIRADQRYVFRFFKTAAEAKDAKVIVSLVSEPGRAPLTVMPDLFRAEVNVAALTSDLKTESGKRKFLPKRAGKQFLRAVAYACGAGGSAYRQNVLDAVGLRDLDYVDLFLPNDALMTMDNHLDRLGLKPEEAQSYEDACIEGWAPAPKTASQKAIWDKVHQAPTDPLKIVPESQRKAAK